MVIWPNMVIWLYDLYGYMTKYGCTSPKTVWLTLKFRHKGSGSLSRMYFIPLYISTSCYVTPGTNGKGNSLVSHKDHIPLTACLQRSPSSPTSSCRTVEWRKLQTRWRTWCEGSIGWGSLTIYDHVVVDCETTHPSNEFEVLQMVLVIQSRVRADL